MSKLDILKVKIIPWHVSVEDLICTFAMYRVVLSAAEMHLGPPLNAIHSVRSPQDCLPLEIRNTQHKGYSPDLVSVNVTRGGAEIISASVTEFAMHPRLAPLRRLLDTHLNVTC